MKKQTSVTEQAFIERSWQQFVNGLSRPFLVNYDYTQDGVTEHYGFMCRAHSAREAAEKFWNQHPGEWFTLVSVNDGTIELFWSKLMGRFVTIPDRENG